MVKQLRMLLSEKISINIYSTNDVFCPPSSLPAVYVINTDYRERSGEHYVTFYLEEGPSATYFDSYGLPPWTCLKQFWTRLGAKSVSYSTRCLQSPLSNVCACYCIAFLYSKSNGVTLKEFVEAFTTDLDINDEAVVGFLTRLLSSV